MAATNGSQDAWDETRRAVEPVPPSSNVAPDIADALRRWLIVDGSGPYDTRRLHSAGDLSPDICERKSWYRTHGTLKDASSLATELRFMGGRVFEAAVVAALKHAGLEIETQVVVDPLRPSSWAWAPGKADVLLVKRKHLLEVKAPRASAFARAKGDATKLVRLAYRFQASRYYHELKAQGRCETASFLFVDREGANAPVEVPLSPSLLIPLDEIVALETRKAAILTMPEPPPRLPYATETRVWKGTKATGRRVESREVRSWQCSYCAFAGTCKPGPEEQPCAAPPGAMAILEDEAKRHAEEAWVSGSTSTPFVYTVTPRDVAERLTPSDIRAAVAASMPSTLPAGAQPATAGENTAGGAAGREETRPVVAPPAEEPQRPTLHATLMGLAGAVADGVMPYGAALDAAQSALAHSAQSHQIGGGDHPLSPAPPPVAPHNEPTSAADSVAQATGAGAADSGAVLPLNADSAPVAGSSTAVVLNPGSDAALDAGCLCPVLDNAHGKGRGDGCFVMVTDCPLHGAGLTGKLDAARPVPSSVLATDPAPLCPACLVAGQPGTIGREVEDWLCPKCGRRFDSEPVAIETWKGGERTAVEVAPPAVTLSAEDIRLRLGRHAREGLASDMLGLTDLSLPQPTLTTEVMNQAAKIHGKDAVDALFVEVGGRYGAGKKIRRRLALSGVALRWFVSKLAPVGLGKTAPPPSATTVADATAHGPGPSPLPW